MSVVGRGVCPHTCKHPQKEEELDLPGYEIKGVCELPDVGNEN